MIFSAALYRSCLLILSLMAFGAMGSRTAFAGCHVNAESLEIATRTLDFGIIQPASGPVTRTVPISIGGTYYAGPNGDDCKLGIVLEPFGRSSSAMAKANDGKATLPYVIRGLMHVGLPRTTGAMLASQNAKWELSLASERADITERPFRATLAAQVVASPDPAQSAGPYQDGVVARIFDLETGALLYVHEMVLLADVSKTCSFGPASSMTVAPSGRLGAKIAGAFSAAITCNAPALIVRSSARGDKPGSEVNEVGAHAVINALMDSASPATVHMAYGPSRAPALLGMGDNGAPSGKIISIVVMPK